MLRLLLWVPAALAACAGPGFTPLPTGGGEAAVRAVWGAPTGHYPLADGATRLEYATGPFGRTTWMVDVGADGAVLRAEQVLAEGNLRRVQSLVDGMTRAQLMRTLGRPGEVLPGGWPGGTVWSWRYETFDCLWFQVSVGDDGVANGSGVFTPDPMCDADGDDRDG